MLKSAARHVVRFEKAIELNPRYASAHSNLGAALAQQGKIDLAIPHLQQAVEYKPDMADTRNNLAVALAMTGRWNDAIPHLEQAVKLSGGREPMMLDLPGRAYSETGRFGDAVKAARRALTRHMKRSGRVWIRIFPDRTVKAAQINALGLIDELQHYALKQYREQRNPRVMQEALDYLTAQIGPEEVEKTLRRFIDEFPPVAVYRGEVPIDEYLKGETNGMLHHQVELEEMLMLWLANQNPAFTPYRELFDDTPLRQETAYPLVMTGMREFFATQPTFGLDNQHLIDFLRSPALASPDSLLAQLEYMRGRWGIILGQYLHRILGGLDAPPCPRRNGVTKGAVSGSSSRAGFD